MFRKVKYLLAVLIMVAFLPMAAFATATINWVDPAFPAYAKWAITWVIARDNWAGTSDQKLSIWSKVTKNIGPSYGVINPCYYDNGIKFMVCYLTDPAVTVGPYGSTLAGEIYTSGGIEYKLWYKLVPAQIPSGAT